MDLSSMYGITLPVLLFSLQKEEVIELLKSVDSKFNAFIIDDFNKSLNYMQQLSEVIRIGRANMEPLSDKQKRTPILDLPMEDQITVNMYIKFEIITEIAKLEATGHTLDPSFSIDDFLTDINHVSFVKARRSIRELLPLHLSSNGSSKTFEYLSKYDLDVIMPDELNDIKLSDLDSRIMKFYYLRLIEYAADIDRTVKTIDNLDSESVQTLLRRPRAMYYRVYDTLAPLQDITTTQVLDKTIGDLRTNLDMQYENICSTTKGQSYAHKEVVDKVGNIFSVTNLNNTFNVTMSKAEWEEEFERMDSLCICGMNFITSNLYEKAILDFTPKSGIVSDESTLTEYKNVIIDIRTALDSLIPFGTPIE